MHGAGLSAKPGMFDVKAKYKWEAWTQLAGTCSRACSTPGPPPLPHSHVRALVHTALLSGTSKDKAMELYIKELDAITGK